MKKIIVVGSLNMDMVIHAPYCPGGGETLTGSGFMTNCGGKGLNQAVAAVKLGGRVSICGRLGNDAFGNTILSNLDGYGVDTQFVFRAEGVSTGIAFIMVTDGENRIILDAGANAVLTTKDIDMALASANEGDIYLTQSENPVEVIGYGLRKAKERGMFTTFNPAPAKTESKQFFRYADLIVPNESEADLLGGKEEMFNAGARVVITTLGKKGYEIATPEKTERYSCIRVQATDTTGAGDTLCGGLAAGLARGESLEQAISFASKAASLACTRQGAAQSIPTYKEVKGFLG